MITRIKHIDIVILSIFLFIVGTFSQVLSQPIFKYKDYIKKPENTNIIERKVWRYNLEKDKPKVLPKIDTIYKFDTIRNVNDSILRINTKITQIRYYQSSSDFEFPDTVLYSKELFNEEGLCTYIEGYFPGVDQPNYSYRHYKYDKKNREVEYQTSYDTIHQSFIYKTIFDDNKLTVLENSDNNYYSYSLNNYDKNSNLFLNELIDTNHKLIGKVVYTYSNNGLSIKDMYFGQKADGSFTLFTLDKNGKILTDISYNKDSTFNFGRYYEYDNFGNLLLDSLVDNLKTAPRKSFRSYYDSNNKLQLVKAKYGKDEYYIQKKYFYRKDGLLDYYLYFDEEGNAATKYQYQYKFR